MGAAVSEYRQHSPASHRQYTYLRVLAQPGCQAMEKGARNLWMGCWEVTLLCYEVYSVNGKARCTGRFWVIVWLLTESLLPVMGEFRSSAKPHAFFLSSRLLSLLPLARGWT